MGKFEIGRVFGNSFAALSRNAPLFLGLAALISGVPTLLMGYAGINALDPGQLANGLIANNYPGIAGGWLITFICGALLQASLVRATIEDLNGKTPVFADCFQTALTVLFPTIGISILVAIGSGFGLLLLIVPGVVLWLGWCVAIPVLVQERLGVFGSMSRSRKLTKGSRFSLFGLFIVLIIALWAIQMVFGILALASGTIFSPFMAAIGSTITAAIMSTGTAAAYVELRTTKEGASFESLAEIFA